MEYIVGMGAGSMIYRLSFINIGLGILYLFGDKDTDTQTAR
jgi:hypothetical protein